MEQAVSRISALEWLSWTSVELGLSQGFDPREKMVDEPKLGDAEDAGTWAWP